MKNIFTFLLTLCAALCKAQDIQKITPEKAKEFVGEVVTVCGTVQDTYISMVGNVFLNFGGKYPNQTFTVYFPNIANQDSVKQNFKSYDGKNICVTGAVRINKDKPEIEIERESQIISEQ